MQVDIDIPLGGQIVHVTRPDGTTTVSVPRDAFEKAMDTHCLQMASSVAPVLSGYIHGAPLEGKSS